MWLQRGLPDQFTAVDALIDKAFKPRVTALRHAPDSALAVALPSIAEQREVIQP
jgi:hypothetical protein